MDVQSIPIASIGFGEHRRTVVEENVTRLVASIGEVGLQNPIVVRSDGDRRILISGRHRLEAARRLGWSDIPASIKTMDSIDAEIAEIDENLMRQNLTPAEEASAIARRKALYEAKHPETKHGANQHTIGVDKLSTPPERFTAATAKAIGKDERTVQRAAARGAALGEDAEAIVGTSLDKGVEIDALAKMTPEERKPIIEKARSGEKVSACKPSSSGGAKGTKKKKADASNDDESKRDQVGDMASEIETAMVWMIRRVFETGSVPSKEDIADCFPYAGRNINTLRNCGNAAAAFFGEIKRDEGEPMLSKSALDAIKKYQLKYLIRMRELLKKQSDEFEASIKHSWENGFLPKYREDLEWCDRQRRSAIIANKKPFTTEQGKTIRNALHPDTRNEKLCAEAFSLWNAKLPYLVDDNPAKIAPDMRDFPKRADDIINALRRKQR